MKPCLGIIEELRSQIQKQQTVIEELKKENAKLKERLGLNSKNSSKPPSLDQKNANPKVEL